MLPVDSQTGVERRAAAGRRNFAEIEGIATLWVGFQGRLAELSVRECVFGSMMSAAEMS